jgi:hypothetical protein
MTPKQVKGPAGSLDAASGGCVGHRLWHAVRLHDFRSVWSQSGWAMMILGFAGVDFKAYRRKAKPALMAA